MAESRLSECLLEAQDVLEAVLQKVDALVDAGADVKAKAGKFCSLAFSFCGFQARG